MTKHVACCNKLSQLPVQKPVPKTLMQMPECYALSYRMHQACNIPSGLRNTSESQCHDDRVQHDLLYTYVYITYNKQVSLRIAHQTSLAVLKAYLVYATKLTPSSS